MKKIPMTKARLDEIWEELGQEDDGDKYHCSLYLRRMMTEMARALDVAMGEDGPGKLSEKVFTAPKIAKALSVDLKTVHNWVKRGDLKSFKTPGGHLRIRESDFVAFCEQFGFPVSLFGGGE